MAERHDKDCAPHKGLLEEHLADRNLPSHVMVSCWFSVVRIWTRAALIETVASETKGDCVRSALLMMNE